MTRARPTTEAADIRDLDFSRLPRWWLVVAATVPLALVIGLLAIWAASSGLLTPAVRTGDRAPAFALADLDGNPVSLADYEGQVVLLNFWASWCLPCVDEFPVLDEALAAYADEGLAVIGIVYRDRSEAARDFADRFGAAWPMVMDPAEAVAEAYGVFGPPESWLIDREGRVASRQIGPYDAETLEAELERVLGTGDGTRTAEDR
jgi:cytochrome c biogenesis protein CcmG/thiol:disulfide interchange protein DsbE